MFHEGGFSTLIGFLLAPSQKLLLEVPREVLNSGEPPLQHPPETKGLVPLRNQLYALWPKPRGVRAPSARLGRDAATPLVRYRFAAGIALVYPRHLGRSPLADVGLRDRRCESLRTLVTPGVPGTSQEHDESPNQ